MQRNYIASGKRWLEIADTYPVIFGIFVLLLGLGVSWYYFGCVYPARSAIYGAAGQETRGSIVNMHEEEHHNDANTYHADVEFQDAVGQRHLIHGTYDQMRYLDLRENGFATVRYLKSNPSQALEIHSQQGQRPNLLWYAVQCAFLFGTGLVLILYGRARSRPEAVETRYILSSSASKRRPLV